jgi:hypothetical protein
MREWLSMTLEATTPESGNKTKVRTNTAAVFGGVAAGSWVFHLYLWSRFMETQPRVPRAADGLTYPMNNHGWIYYLSAAQDTQLGIMVWLAIIFFVLAAVLTGMQLKWRSPKAEPATKSSLLYFTAGLLVWIAVLTLWSLKFASVLVARGITL